MKKFELVLGENAFTAHDLIQKVALHKGLKLVSGSSQERSEPIKEYELDDELIPKLFDLGFKHEKRPDKICSIVDTNRQEPCSGFAPSCGWNFKERAGKDWTYDLRITLDVVFVIYLEKRGIVLFPQAPGTFVSPSDLLPNFRMFKALTDNDPDATPLAKELSKSDGSITVNWSEIGLGGIRRTVELFAEMTSRSRTVESLAQKFEIFDPAPYSRKSEDTLFITEPAQPSLFETWREQLETYRNSLTL